MKSNAIYTLPLNEMEWDSKQHEIDEYNEALENGDSDEIEDLWRLIQDNFFPFKNCPNLKTIFVPQSLLDDYQNNVKWAAYMDLIGATFVGVPD